MLGSNYAVFFERMKYFPSPHNRSQAFSFHQAFHTLDMRLCPFRTRQSHCSFQLPCLGLQLLQSPPGFRLLDSTLQPDLFLTHHYGDNAQTGASSTSRTTKLVLSARNPDHPTRVSCAPSSRDGLVGFLDVR